MRTRASAQRECVCFGKLSYIRTEDERTCVGWVDCNGGSGINADQNQFQMVWTVRLNVVRIMDGVRYECGGCYINGMVTSATLTLDMKRVACYVYIVALLLT